MAKAPNFQRRGRSVGFRPTPSVKKRLTGAAAANDRSISKEIEFRLEQSFLIEDVIAKTITAMKEKI